MPVPEDQLPVTLPENVVPDGAGSPLARMPEFYECSCPKCGAAARNRHHGHLRRVVLVLRPLRLAELRRWHGRPKAANHWLPVDQYIGGIEHAILHLLYARFFHKLMRDEGLVTSNEPFKNLLTQGMVVAETYYRVASNGGRTGSTRPMSKSNAMPRPIIGARLKTDGLPVEIGGTEKMSSRRTTASIPSR